MKRYKRITERNKLKEGAGVGTEIKLYEPCEVDFKFSYKKGKTKILKMKKTSCELVNLSSYMWGKRVGGKPLFNIAYPIDEIMNFDGLSIVEDRVLYDILDEADLEIDDLKGLEYGKKITNLSEFLESIEKLTGEKVEVIEGNIAVKGSWLEGKGYTSASLGRYVNAENLEGYIYLEIFFESYSQSLEIELDYINFEEIVLEASIFMQKAWNWCWSNWSYVGDDEDSTIDEMEWEDAFNL